MERNLRIYIATATFLPLVGGAENQCLAQASQLRERGYEATVITFRHDRTWLRREVIEGVPVIRIAGSLLGRREKLPRPLQRLLYLLALLVMCWTLWRHHARYDIVHVYHLHLLAVSSALACCLTGKPLIIGVLGASVGKAAICDNGVSLIAGPLDPTTPWLRVYSRTRVGGDLEGLQRLGNPAVRCTRALLRSVRAVVVVLSSDMKDYLITHNFSLPHVQLIPNGVDITRFMPTNVITPLAEQAQVVVCVTRLSYEKGIDVLLQAWRIVYEQAPQARLLIVGTGPVQAQLERLATALGIAESVEFTGLRRDVAVQLQRGSLAVLPSRVEGMSNALLEAMARGLPCVSTRVSGSQDIIQHGINGLLTHKPVILSIQSAGPGETQHIQLDERGAMLMADTLTETSFLKVDLKDWAAGAGDIAYLPQLPFGKTMLDFLRKSNAFYQILSTRSHSYLTSHGFRAEQIVHIPGSVDTERFQPAPERHPDPARPERDIICVARLDYAKGVDVLLHAWGRMLREPAEWRTHMKPRLRLVGQGKYKLQLEQIVMELGIQDSVEFLGLRTDVVDLLQQSWGFVMPSRWEGMPNALLEAMACGLPCVATCVSGSEDIITDNVNGLLVEPEQPAEMAQALRRLIEDTELAQRLGRAGRATVVCDYQLASIIEQGLELYRCLLAGEKNVLPLTLEGREKQ